MPHRILTLRELNRTLLARQLLLTRMVTDGGLHPSGVDPSVRTKLHRLRSGFSS